MAQRNGRARTAPWLRFFAFVSLFTPLITVVLSGADVAFGWFLFVQLGATALAVTQWMLADALERLAKMQELIERKFHIYVQG